ncbi:hypothetical protein J6590_035836, partial [Homalodisca vitripennis]
MERYDLDRLLEDDDARIAVLCYIDQLPGGRGGSDKDPRRSNVTTPTSLSQWTLTGIQTTSFDELWMYDLHGGKTFVSPHGMSRITYGRSVAA